MSLPSGFEIIQKLYQQNGITFYRAKKNSTKNIYILKSTDINSNRPQAIKESQEEFEIGKKLKSFSVLTPLFIENFHDSVLTLFEDFKGESLATLVSTQVSLENFLKISKSIVGAIEELHQLRIIHKDLRPGNIFINQITFEVKITGLRLSSVLSEKETTSSSNIITGTFPYMSPEQTGKMNRPIDYRSDFYSLGIILYELLTGHLPLKSDDPLEWIHYHIARTPKPPHELRPEVPRIISKIILTLLSKMPEDRYQTSSGIIHDLDICLEQLKQEKDISPFQLKQKDISGNLTIPQFLFGRQKEIEMLKEALSEVSKTGIPEMITISGYSGVGKTSLAFELKPPVFEKQGHFLTGKFDQYKKDIPYTPFIQAFQDLIQTILSEDEKSLEKWISKIKNALGSEGQVIIDVLPQLELLIGPQPKIPSLSALETLNRFKKNLFNFIMVFASKNHPLVIFIDDLQWADSASLVFLQEVMTSPQVSSILIIGAYRENEVFPGHPIIETINLIRDSGTKISEITLKHLSFDVLKKFIANTLNTTEHQVHSLTELIFEKTIGNPFFVIQFFLLLKEEGLIHFDREITAWVWDVDRIRSQNFADNVVELIIRKIQKLPPETQKNLKDASYFGRKVSIQDLSAVFGYPKEELEKSFKEALMSSIIHQVNKSYEFTHDRIQETIYLQDDQLKRTEAHLKIGRVFLKSFDEKILEKRIFEVTGHLNLAKDIIYDEGERINLAELNLMAARQARSGLALLLASRYCEYGLSLLNKNAWIYQYKTISALNLILAECELANSHIERTEEIISQIKEKMRTLEDKCKISQILSNVHTVRGNMIESLKTGIDCLRLFEIKISPHPSKEEVEELENKIRVKIEKLDIKNITRLPLMKNREFEGAISILTGMLPGAFYTDVNLHKILCFQILDLTLKHGLAPLSPMGFAALALDLTINEQYKNAFKYGELAETLVNIPTFSASRSKVSNILGVVVIPWSGTYSHAIDVLNQGVEAEGGDILFASFCKIYASIICLNAGNNLQQIVRDAKGAHQFIQNRKIEHLSLGLDVLTRLAQALDGKTAHPISFDLPNSSEQELLNELQNNSYPIFYPLFFIFKMQVAIYYGDPVAALTFAKECEPYLAACKGQPAEADYIFFKSLGIVGAINSVEGLEREKWLNELQDIQIKIHTWAENNPTNFQGRHSLLRAEVARIENKDQDAQVLYEQAISSAREAGFIHLEALAFEKASNYYKKRNLALIAKTYMREAHRCYKQWGANGKIKIIEQSFPQFRDTHDHLSITSFSPDYLDLLSVIKSSQAISSNLVQNNLIDTLMVVLLEQSGAQRVSLTLIQDNHIYIKASSKIGDKGIETNVLMNGNFDDEVMPVSILRFVQRSKTAVILDDATKNNNFVTDTYIINRKIKSLLCLPILREGNLLGVVYFENNITTGVFSKERLTVLELLVSQAAISLQNVQYYDELQRENAHRKDIQENLRASQEQLQSIINSATSIIVIKNLEGRYILVNKSFENIFKRSSKDILDKRDFDIFSYEVAERLRKNDQVVLKSNSSIEFEEEFSHPEGPRTYLSVKFLLYDAQGEAYAVCSISTDISDRKRIEEGKEQLLINARKSIEAQDNFISIASHELRTPLTPLRIYLDILKKILEEPDSDAIPKIELLRKARDISETSLQRLFKLTEDILDASRIISDRLVLQPQEVSLSDIVIETLKLFENEIRLTGSEIKLAIRETPCGYWDKARISQVIGNLISNALKYGEARPIEIMVDQVADHAQCIITDHGPGISKETQNKIFERFQRSSIRHFGGLGLGLYISKEIVTAHGGTIALRSKIGEGSSFIVELPFRTKLSYSNEISY